MWNHIIKWVTNPFLEKFLLQIEKIVKNFLIFNKLFPKLIYYSTHWVFWVNIAKSELNLRYKNYWNLFGILRRETEFRYYHCRNSTKSMREKKKKVERENVEFRQCGYRNSFAQFYCPGVRGVRRVPKVKRKKNFDKLIVAMPLPK